MVLRQVSVSVVQYGVYHLALFEHDQLIQGVVRILLALTWPAITVIFFAQQVVCYRRNGSAFESYLLRRCVPHR